MFFLSRLLPIEYILLFKNFKTDNDLMLSRKITASDQNDAASEEEK